MRVVLYAAITVGVLQGCVDDNLSVSTQGVIHGSLTPAGKYPATGALIAQVNGQRVVFCTGTLIAPDAVATAAHCMIPPPGIGDFTPYFTLALNANTAPASQLVQGREKHYHPQYNQNVEAPGTLAHTYDVGIVLLTAPVPNAQIAYLPTPAEAATMMQGMPLEITGYGLTIASDDNSAGVKYDATTTLSAVGQYEIGVGVAGGPQNCHGDSGGPAYMHVGNGLRMVGLVSRGNTGGEDTCDRGGIDTRADAYRSWFGMYTTLADPPADPGPGEGSGSGSGSGSGEGSGSGSGSGDDGTQENGSTYGGCSAGGAAGDFGTLALIALAVMSLCMRARLWRLV
ncbi:MAG TPA: trypsin-like serine protease [Kofleriaceae bacterium]|nr:trypsin-like serine protease [Kofleriaceae bacterium]